MQIIRNREIVEDDYVHVADGAELPADASAKPIVTLARFVKERDALLAKYKHVGVRVPSDKLPQDIPEIDKLAVIAIEFPRWSDGRGYSVGRMLRDRNKYKGELRAVGYVLRDQLFYMARVGFDAFEIKAGKPIESAVQAFKDFSLAYSAAVDDPRPHYRRR